MTTLLLLLGTLTIGATRSQSAGQDWEATAEYKAQLARKYHRQRDDLQRRLTRRVLEVQALRWQLKRALHVRKATPPSRDVAYAIRLAAAAYGVSETEMHRVASCESGHYALARNGQYRGVFQEGPMFEGGPFGRAGFSVWDPVANAMTAAYTVAREGWAQWSCRP